MGDFDPTAEGAVPVQQQATDSFDPEAEGGVSVATEANSDTTEKVTTSKADAAKILDQSQSLNPAGLPQDNNSTIDLGLRGTPPKGDANASRMRNEERENSTYGAPLEPKPDYYSRTTGVVPVTPQFVPVPERGGVAAPAQDQVTPHAEDNFGRPVGDLSIMGASDVAPNLEEEISDAGGTPENPNEAAEVEQGQQKVADQTVGKVGRGIQEIADSGMMTGGSPLPGIMVGHAQEMTQDQRDEAARGVADVLEGGGTLATPLAAEALTGAAAVKGLWGLSQAALEYAAAYAAGKGGAEVAKQMGASPDEQRAVEDLFFFLPSAATAFTHLAEVKGYKISQGEAQVRGVSAFPNEEGVPGVAAGIGKTKGQYGVTVKIGDQVYTVTIPRLPGLPGMSAPENFPEGAEPSGPTGPQESNQAQGGRSLPGQVPQTPQELEAHQILSTAIETAQRANALDTAAHVTANPGATAPQGPTGPQGTMAPQTMDVIAQAIVTADPNLRGPLIQEAIGQMAAWGVQQGTLQGPDGTVVVITSPKQAAQTAAKWLNTSLEAATKAQQGPQKEEEAPPQGQVGVTVPAKGSPEWNVRPDQATAISPSGEATPFNPEEHGQKVETEPFKPEEHGLKVEEPTPTKKPTAVAERPATPAPANFPNEEAKKGEIRTFIDHEGKERTGTVKSANDLAVRFEADNGEKITVAPSKVRGVVESTTGEGYNFEDWPDRHEATTLDEALHGAFHMTDGMQARWAELRKTGATDAQISNVLESSLGGYARTGGFNTRRGMVEFGKNSVSFKQDGKTETVKGAELVKKAREVLQIPKPKAASKQEEKPEVAQKPVKELADHETPSNLPENVKKMLEKGPVTAAERQTSISDKYLQAPSSAEVHKRIHATDMARIKTLTVPKLLAEIEELRDAPKRHSVVGDALERNMLERQALRDLINWRREHLDTDPAEVQKLLDKDSREVTQLIKAAAKDKKYPWAMTYANWRADANEAERERLKNPPKEGKHKYGSTQADIHGNSEASDAMRIVRAKIADADLAGQGKDVEGNHVTLRYGIKDDDHEDIRQYLEQQAPFEATLGATASFPPSEHSDGAAVIIAPIEAPELHYMNAEIAKYGSFIEPSFPDYKPHATIAYVKPEAAKKYTGLQDTKGKKFQVRSITISKKDGTTETVELKGTKLQKGDVVEFERKGMTEYGYITGYDEQTGEYSIETGEPGKSKVVKLTRDKLTLSNPDEPAAEQPEEENNEPQAEGEEEDNSWQYVTPKDIEESIAEGKSNASLIPWAEGKEGDPVAAIEAHAKTMVAAGWIWHPKQKEVTKDGWYAFYRSQGSLSTPILQWQPIKEAAKPKTEMSDLELELQNHVDQRDHVLVEKNKALRRGDNAEVDRLGKVLIKLQQDVDALLTAVMQEKAEAKAQPTSSSGAAAKPAKEQPVREGKMGDMLSAGEVVLTVTGRKTTPFPKIDTNSDRKANNTIKRVDQWLMDNAIAEARARGDEFNLRQFEQNRDNPSKADKDSAEMYLFDKDTVVPIPRPLSKPIAANPIEQARQHINAAGLVDKGNIEHVMQFEHPEHPGVTMSAKAADITSPEAVKKIAQDKLAAHQAKGGGGLEDLKGKYGIKEEKPAEEPKPWKSEDDPEQEDEPEPVAAPAPAQTGTSDPATLKEGNVIVFDKVPPGSYLETGHPFKIEEVSDRSVYLRSTIDGGGTSENLVNLTATAKWHLLETPKETPKPAPVPAPEPQTPAKSLDEHLFHLVSSDQMPADNNALKKIVAEFDGKAPDALRMKQAQEALEVAIVRQARAIVDRGYGPLMTFEALLQLYNSQPNLNIRTSTSVENQAYSTPAPLAYLAGLLAGIDHSATVYEPTAGTGMLLIGADPAKSIVNELNPERAALLKAQGYKGVTTLNAVSPTVVPPKVADSVITNPPFGSMKDAQGKLEPVRIDNYKITKLEQVIAARALAAMKDNGKATMILGASKVAGEIGAADSIFFNWLYSTYNVTSHFEVEGDLYNRQGAGWPVRVITVDGRNKSQTLSPKSGTIVRAKDWNEVYARYLDGLAAQQHPGATATSNPQPDSAVQGPSGGNDEGTVPQPVDQQAGGVDRGESEGSPAVAGNEPGAEPGSVPDSDLQPEGTLGAGDRGVRPDDDTAQSNRLEDDGEPVDDLPQPAPETGTNPRTPVDLADPDNQFQVPYAPASRKKDVGVLIPTNMRQPLEEAMRSLEDQVGDIDKFVAKELGYKSLSDLHDAFMGLQIDAVAAAIHQTNRGKGVIIADQTGIGKGRQAAAMIRWAARKGRIPVFVTAKPQPLFSDMYGDLQDIGSDNIRPLIVNIDEAITTTDGQTLFANKKSTHRKDLEKIVLTGKLPGDRNALFITYSQVNVPNLQQSLLMRIAPDAHFILDESHNAGGESNQGEFIRAAVAKSAGVTYLSATFAKRPDNMPLYFKTDIGMAIGDNNSLVEAMKRGGLPLQTVVSHGLVQSGQMFRRERSFKGIHFHTETDTAHRERDRAWADMATEGLRAIVNADRYFSKNYVKNMQKELKAQDKAADWGSRITGTGGNKASSTASHTEFTAIVHNFVRQMLLGIKVDETARRAIQAIKNGEKPVIAVDNTMGSFLEEFTETHGLKEGDQLKDFDYRTVLSRALTRTRVIVIKTKEGDEIRKFIPLEELDPETRAIYDQAQAVIDKIDLPIPVSPIDAIRQKINDAGHSIAEITGRKLAVDYSDPKMTRLASVPKDEKNRTLTVRKFNDGRLDALVLNVAGSTGLSAHASERFKDQKPRRMIVAQAAQDINIFMQMLGRINRTGQVVKPSYTLLNSDLPAEKRPSGVLSKKMKSLNANTSSNTESATSVQAVDLFNKYGDQVVGAYLEEYPELQKELQVAPNDEDVARTATGRLALLPVARQEAFYNDIEHAYNTLIDYLNQTNQNELEPKTLDYEAQELKSQVIHEATDSSSAFGKEAVYGEYSVKMQAEPLKPEEVRAKLDENLAGKTAAQFNRDMMAELDPQLQHYLSTLEDGSGAYQLARQVASVARQFLANHPIGSTYRIDVNGDIYSAAVVDIRNGHRGHGNPYALSKFTVRLAVAGPMRYISVPATQLIKIEGGYLGTSPEAIFRNQPTNMREQAKIITGNLLAAYGEIADGSKGTIINFTKADGTTEQGILLPKKFNPKESLRNDVRMLTPEHAVQFLQRSRNIAIESMGIQSRDGDLRVVRGKGGTLTVITPKSKARGGKYFLDHDITALTGDFASVGQTMQAKIPHGREAEVLKVLMTKNALYAAPSMAEEAKLYAPKQSEIQASANLEPFNWDFPGSTYQSDLQSPIAAKFYPSKGVIPPIITMSGGARLAVMRASQRDADLKGMTYFYGLNLDGPLAHKLGNGLEQLAKDVDNGSVKDQNPADIRRLAAMLHSAGRQMHKGGVIALTDRMPHSVLEEELFHAMQRYLGEGSMQHLSPEALSRLAVHPAAQILMPWLKEHGYKDFGVSGLINEISAKLFTYDEEMYHALDNNVPLAADFMVEYLYELDGQHGEGPLHESAKILGDEAYAHIQMARQYMYYRSANDNELAAGNQGGRGGGQGGAQQKGGQGFLSAASQGQAGPAAGHPGEPDRITDTPAFKEWFGKSKVVDANGQPLVVYHGTDRFPEVFDRKASAGWRGHQSIDNLGNWFSDSPEKAGHYALGGIMPAYLRIENPFHLRPSAPTQVEQHLAPEETKKLREYEKVISARGTKVLTSKELREYRDLDSAERRFAQGNASRDKLDGDAWRKLQGLWETLHDLNSDQLTKKEAKQHLENKFRGNADMVVEHLKERGYDGIIVEDTKADGEPQTMYIAFDPNQIKSSIGNSGAFDRSNPNMAMAVTPRKVSQETKKAVDAFWKADIEPKAEKFAGGLGEIARSMVSTIYPRIEDTTAIGHALGIGVNRDVMDAAMTLKGDREKAMHLLEEFGRGVKKFFDHIPEEERIAFLDNYKTGEPQATPKLDELAKFYKAMDQAMYEMVRQYRPSLNQLENHFRLFWDKLPQPVDEEGNLIPQPADTRKGLNRFFSKRPFQGTRGMLKKHTLETASEGLDRGGTLVSTNPQTLFELGQMDSMKYVTAQRFWEELGDLGHRKFVRNGQRPPIGFTKLDDQIAKVYFPATVLGGGFKDPNDIPTFDDDNGEASAHVDDLELGRRPMQTGEWWVEENSNRILNNFLSRDLIRETAAGRGLLWMKNMATAVELGLSPFHAVFETIEAMGSQFSLGLTQAYNQGLRQGDLNALLRGFGNMATFPLAPVTMATAGGHMIDYAKILGQKGEVFPGLPSAGNKHNLPEPPRGKFAQKIHSISELRQLTRAGKFLRAHPDADVLLHDLFAGGAQLNMNRDYDVATMKTIREQWTAGNYIGAVLRVVPALGSEIMAPLFKTYIPRLKVGFFLAQYSQQLAERERDLVLGKITRAELARQVWQSVENRFGEMNFDNLFWNRTFKTTMQLAFRSVTWKGGNVGLFAGGSMRQSRDVLNWLQHLPDVAKGGGGGKLPPPPKGKAGASQPGGQPPIGETLLPHLDKDFAWILGVMFVTAVLGTIATYLMSRTSPWQQAEEDSDGSTLGFLKALYTDTVHPWNGSYDYRGKKIRFSLPTYWKDFEHGSDSPRHYVVGSFSSLLAKSIDIMENRNFQNNYVYDPNAPLMHQWMQMAEYAAPKPFSFSNYQQMTAQGGNSGAGLASSFGFTKAAADTDWSPAERRMMDLLSAGHAPETPEQIDEYRNRKNMIEQGQGSMADRRKALYEMTTPWPVKMFKKLDYDQAVDVYQNYATPQEQAMLAPLLKAKMERKLKSGTLQSGEE